MSRGDGPAYPTDTEHQGSDHGCAALLEVAMRKFAVVICLCAIVGCGRRNDAPTDPPWRDGEHAAKIGDFGSYGGIYQLHSITSGVDCLIFENPAGVATSCYWQDLDPKTGLPVPRHH